MWELRAQVVSLSVCLFVHLFVVFHFHLTHGCQPSSQFWLYCFSVPHSLLPTFPPFLSVFPPFVSRLPCTGSTGSRKEEAVKWKDRRREGPHENVVDALQQGCSNFFH